MVNWPSVGKLFLGPEFSTSFAAAAFGLAYVAYYLLLVVQKPLLACKNGKLKRVLLESCPSLTRAHWPTSWCWGGRINTVVSVLVKSEPSISYDEREILKLADGGEIIIEWLIGAGDAESRPTVVILPGINGDATASYVQHLVSEVSRLGYRAVVINHRGRGGITLRTPRSYCACNTDDLKAAIGYVRQKHPKAPIMAIGISLGGLILFHYIVQHGRKNSGLIGGMSISMAWDVFETSKELEKPLNRRLLNRPVAEGLVKGISQYLPLFQGVIDADDVRRSKTIREFDERFTSKVFGYASLDAYYNDATASTKVHRVDIPLLCLNAADDPFSPACALPIDAANANEHLMLVVPKHGGHVAFCDHPIWPCGPGYMEKLASEYISALFKNADKFQVD